MTIDYNKLQVSIRLDHLRQNYRTFKKLCGNVIPVIKSDAYGHGLVKVCNALEPEAETFAVGFVNEAVKLRDSGFGGRILALLGPADDADYAALWSHDILAEIGTMEQLIRLSSMTRSKGALEVALKFDTGMRRLGFRPDDVADVIAFLKENRGIKPVMVSSHFASADMPESTSDVDGQVAQFFVAVNGLRDAGFVVEANIANSAGGLGYEAYRLDSMRLGIAMYGCNPFYNTDWAELGDGLKPAMEVSAPIMSVHPLGKGEGISYGWTHVAEQDRMVAIVGVGYADAYSRGMSNTGFMNIAGRRAPILGRVCMQMTAVDVTDIMGDGTGVAAGDRAWLLGGPGEGAITPEDLAGWWNTITYEVFCLLGMNQREYI